MSRLRHGSGSFLTAEGRRRVQAAIAAAERLTSGEIRVRAQPRAGDDPRPEAEAWFSRLGMDRTAARNGVLIFVAWRDRRFAVIGDAGIHARVGDGFWTGTVEAMARHFAANDVAAGLEAGIAALGHALAVHFPRAADDRNELPDEISDEE